MTKIADKMTKDLNLIAFHDGYQERMEALIGSKMKGEVAQMKETRLEKPATKRMMEACPEYPPKGLYSCSWEKSAYQRY